jgi:hypothetical protein
MKCPKCKYITFDYLYTCPRCGKDMTPEKEKLNISSVKPNTPFLLGTLTGDLNDSSVGIKVPESTEEGAEGMMLGDEEVYDDGSELSIDIDEKDMSESDKDTELDFTSDNISPEIEEGAVEEKEGGSDSKEVESQESVKKEEAEKDSEEIDLDMEDLELKLDFDEDEDFKK